MPTMDQLLARVVERKGFLVQGADAEGLLARRGEESLLVAWKINGPITAADAQLFTTAMEQVHASSGILVAPKGCEQAVKDHAASMKTLEIWAESRLVVEVGDAFVKDALGVPGIDAPASTPMPMAAAPAPAPRVNTAIGAGQSLVARAATASSGDTRGAAMYMPNKPRTVTPEPRMLNYAWGGAPSGTVVDPGVAQIRNGRRPTPQAAAAATPVHQDVDLVSTPRQRAASAPTPMIVPENDDVELVSTPRQSRAAAPAPAPKASSMHLPALADDEEEYEIITTPKKNAASPKTADAAPQESDSLRASLSREEAGQRAADKVGAVKSARLSLVPHVTFEYNVRVERKELDTPLTGKGAFIVSSVTGELRTVPKLDVGESPADARRESPKLQAVDVYDKVKSSLTKLYSRDLRVQREVGGVDVSENIRISPSLDELGLSARGILYVPIWEITGTTGSVRVDAHSGDLV